MSKKLLLLCFVVCITLCAKAQVPQALNYQAIARNTDGTIIPGQSIGVRFSILDGGASGTVLYQETNQVVTNNFGLFTLAIGNGNSVTGSFTSIDWGTVSTKFLRVEIAPQGGNNYQLQGATQFLSIPYALYAEKTKLVAGNGISILNGNTISANYQAGVGINISGNTISGSYVAGTGIAITGNTIAGNYVAGSGVTITGNIISSSATNNSWLLAGNTGTNTTNFLGTTDNQPLLLRTNNTDRLRIDAGQAINGGSLSTAFLSEFASIRTSPAQLVIYGKDVNGISVPLHLFSSVEGMTWTATGGNNNTLGRFMRMTQMNSANYSTGNYFDIGIDQGVSLYISDRGQNSVTGVLPKKMITISPQNFVGINFNWGEDPTANLHTKGTLRFEGVNTNNTLTRILVMDVNGNVASRDANTFGNSFWVADVNGIHNSNTGHVGIGGQSSNLHALIVDMMDNTSDGRAIVKFTSNDLWQTNLWMHNTSNNASFNFVVGGVNNTLATYGAGAKGFGIVNVSNGSTIPLIITEDNKIGISNSLGGTNNTPRSRLHVRDGDIYIDQIGAGVIMKSPNGQCWRMTVSDAGTPVFTSIPCP
ncbi:MAG: hypothetical protein JNN00_10245 [Chitinophagaceae bacterium]|nr:hypothetical protein [Chitinophagaceae bacterium]